jgi:hypothetical protein
MAFNKAPNSWLTGYTFTSNEISFSLSGDYTTECQDAMGLIFRVTDEILKKYTAKASADKPVQWESTSVIAQPVQGSPNSLKTITNKFVLDAELFAGLATPSLEVTISTPDMVYTGFAYGAVSHTAPSGSSVTITYSADGGQTFSSTAPTARGSYIARIVATKDGRSGTARSGFSILKSTPAVTAGTDITLEYSSGTINTNFYSVANFTSITSSNPAVVSVVSFTAGGAVVLQKNGVGQADIIASTAETSEYYSAEGSKAVILTTKEATITAPTTLAISVANGLSQNFTFTTNFTLTAQRYALMEFESSDEDVATISKGSSYPPTIEIVAGGLFTITSRFPGDSEYGETASTTSVTISGATPVQTVTIVKGPSQALFSGDDGIVITPPESPATSPWESGKLWTLRIGLDSDNNGEIDGQIPTLPYVFTITIANTQGQQGTTGALSTSFTNFATNNWISFSVSGNTITGTISSLPTTINNGEVSGCALFASKAAADGVLAWQGQFDINIYKAGPRLRILASGLSGTANSTFTEITQSSLTLNQNGEYTEWLTSDECCPHVIKLKVLKADGVGAGSITVEAKNSGGGDVSEHTGFDFGAKSKVVSDGDEFNFNIDHGGTSMLRAYLTGGNPNYQKDIAITANKFTPSIELEGGVPSFSNGVYTNSPTKADCAGTGVDIDGAHQGGQSIIIIGATPEGIAWDGITQSRLSVTFSTGSAGVAQKIQKNGGKTQVNINNNSVGDAVMTSTLLETDKYKSVTFLKNYRVVKPYLFTTKSVENLSMTMSQIPCGSPSSATYTVKQQTNQLFISKCPTVVGGVGLQWQQDGDIPIIYKNVPANAAGAGHGTGIVPSRRKLYGFTAAGSTISAEGIAENYTDGFDVFTAEGVFGLSGDSSAYPHEVQGSIAYFTNEVLGGGSMGSVAQRYQVFFRQKGLPQIIKQNTYCANVGNFNFVLGDVKIYMCPTLPYKDGVMGDYYQTPSTPPTTLTYPTDFSMVPWAAANVSGLIPLDFFAGVDNTVVGHEIPTT